MACAWHGLQVPADDAADAAPCAIGPKSDAGKLAALRSAAATSAGFAPNPMAVSGGTPGGLGPRLGVAASPAGNGGANLLGKYAALSARK